MKYFQSFIPAKLAMLALALYAPATQAATEPVTVLAGLDPVALIQGQEAKGREELQTTRGRYRYLFANAENKNRFEAAPWQYGIQFDGYCMKMGPLSGRGSPERYFVHDGRIYLFASDGCRDGFKAAPEAFTDRADAPPTGTDEERMRGRELLDRALTGFGGAEKVDALKNFRTETRTVYEQQNAKTEVRHVTTLVFPDRLRMDESWGDASYGSALADGVAVDISLKGVDILPADVRDFLTRRLYREPLAILRARGQPGFVAVAAGRGEVSGTAVEWVKTAFAGATTMLGVDPASGRILQIAYRGRAPSKLGEIRKTFSDFRAMKGGLTVPFETEVAYDGQPSTQPKPSGREIALNVPVDATLFPKPY